MLNQGAVIESLAQGHAASEHGADMWINAGTFTLDLYARPQVIQEWNLRGDCFLVTVPRQSRKQQEGPELESRNLHSGPNLPLHRLPNLRPSGLLF